MEPQARSANLEVNVRTILGVDSKTAQGIINDAERLYKDRMQQRFSQLRVRERLKRTNPFLLRIRGLETVREWAETQVTSALFASEEEAVGHLLEAIAKWCHPGSQPPRLPDDFDYEVVDGSDVYGYQVKMSWDCMPMSSRKNLSNTIRNVSAVYEREGKTFHGLFAPCYGKARTTTPPGQEYTSLGSRGFWAAVGGSTDGYDVKVGEVCALLCSEFRSQIQQGLIPDLIEKLTVEATPLIGNDSGDLMYEKLFRQINR